MNSPERGRLLGDRLVALLLLAFAVYIVAQARQLSYAQGRVPGPGFAPFWIGLGLGLAALAILAGSWMGRPPRGAPGPPQPEEDESPAVRPWTLLAMGAATVLGVALVDRLGMLAALTLLLLALVRIVGGSWRAAVLTSLGLPLLFYFLFGLSLKVPLPRGPWGF